MGDRSDKASMTMSLFANSLFENLKLSDRPVERAAQVRVLKDVFSVLEQRHLAKRAMKWSSLSELADTPVIAEVVDEMVQSIPPDEDFGSFEELKARRDETGVARLRR